MHSIWITHRFLWTLQFVMYITFVRSPNSLCYLLWHTHYVIIQFNFFYKYIQSCCEKIYFGKTFIFINSFTKQTLLHCILNCERLEIVSFCDIRQLCYAWLRKYLHRFAIILQILFTNLSRSSVVLNEFSFMDL